MKPGWLVIVALVGVVGVVGGAGCACKGSSPGGTGPGTGGGTGRADATCDGQVAHVRTLYQADAVDLGAAAEAAVADNVAMVMKECAVEPARVAPCLAAARTATILERSCLPALDDDGSEGRVFTDR